MAKRKRLSPAVLAAAAPAAAPPASARPPIANVAGDAAEQAALQDVARALSDAREEGRLIQKLPLEAIETAHLVRDRMAFDEAEMAALKGSLAARGQQVPIEVVALEAGRYGLISGLRRVMALSALGQGEVLALVRRPESSAEAYLAMVEENEIRAGISFYERARLASEAARLGLYDSASAAIAALFGSASPAKRSKIGSFVRVHEALGEALRFPAAIPERLGLALAAALTGPTGEAFASRLSAELRTAPPEDATAERSALEAALKTANAKPARGAKAPVMRKALAPGLTLESRAGRLVVSGERVTPELLDALENWLKSRV